MNNLPGRLIAIEGIDGAGTTTQAHLLVDWLNEHGHKAHFTGEPTAGPVGQLLRRILRHEERAIDRASIALLFAADRVDHLRQEIAPLLDQGVLVVTDRYVYSSLAYQGHDLDLRWVADLNRLAPEPDLTIYLRVDPLIAAQRREKRGSERELFEEDELQRRISQMYDQLLGASPAAGYWLWDERSLGWQRHQPSEFPSAARRLTLEPRCAIIDGSANKQILHEQLRLLVKMVCFQQADHRG